MLSVLTIFEKTLWEVTFTYNFRYHFVQCQ